MSLAEGGCLRPPLLDISFAGGGLTLSDPPVVDNDKRGLFTVRSLDRARCVRTGGVLDRAFEREMARLAPVIRINEDGQVRNKGSEVDAIGFS